MTMDNKKSLFFLLLIISVCIFSVNASNVQAAEKSDQVAYTQASSNNLRSDRVADAEIVQKLPINTKIKILEKNGEWVSIQVADQESIQGWLHQSLLAKLPLTLEEALERYTETPKGNLKKLKWIERAAALAPRNREVLKVLFQALQSHKEFERAHHVLEYIVELKTNPSRYTPAPKSQKVIKPIALATNGNQLYVADAITNRIAIIDVKSGELKWFKSGDRRFYKLKSIDIKENYLYVLTAEYLFIFTLDKQQPISHLNLSDIGVISKNESPKSSIWFDLKSDTAYFSARSTVYKVDLTTQQSRPFVEASVVEALDLREKRSRFSPQGLELRGNHLYVAECNKSILLKVNVQSGLVERLAGGGGKTLYGRGYVDEAGEKAAFGCLYGITSNENFLFVADTGNHCIRRIELSSGRVSTLAGGGGPGHIKFGFQDGKSNEAAFYEPYALAIEGSTLYVADRENYAVRKVNIDTAEVTTLLTPVDTVVVNSPRVNALLRKAEEGDANYQAQLGELLLQAVGGGDNVEAVWSGRIRSDRDYFNRDLLKQAMISLLKAADQGHAQAQFLAARLASHYGVQPEVGHFVDYISLYRRAAEQGHAKAQQRMGAHFNAGLETFAYHVKPDPVKAFEWYYKAAKQGMVGSMQALGRYYQNGEGIQQNLEQAEKWYRLAAEQDDTLAQVELGCMMVNRDTPDFVEGLMWLEIVWARPYGFDYDGLGCLPTARQKANTAEREEAERLAQKWLNDHPNSNTEE